MDVSEKRKVKVNCPTGNRIAKLEIIWNLNTVMRSSLVKWNKV